MKILLVDDHALFLEGLRLLLKRGFPDAQVVESGSGREALRRLQEVRPHFDLVILDLSMTDLDGFEFLASAARLNIPTPVVIVSATTEPAYVDRALSAGALGFIPKHAPPETLLQGIRQILYGTVYLPPALAQELRSWRRLRAQGSFPSRISSRQLDVLKLLTEGLSNREIGERLNILESTVKTHVTSLLRMTNAPNRTACILAARKLGWIS